MRTKRRWQVGMVCIVLVALLAPAVNAFDYCGVQSGFDSLWFQTVPDIDCETGRVTLYGSTVTLVPGAHISEAIAGATAGILESLGSSTIDITAGVIDSYLNTGSTDIVTIYGSDFAVDGTPVEDQIVNTGGSTYIFDLTGVYADGSPINFQCRLGSGGVINLNLAATAPDIKVYPVADPVTGIRAYDVGEVAICETLTVPNIVYIYNEGNENLTVTSVSISGDPSISLTPSLSFPLVIEPGLNNGQYFDVTFAPTAAGLVEATVTIESDDEDEGVIEVILSGTGVVEVVYVDIDIKPDSEDNTVNLGSNGVIPVGILSTVEFDATQVDPESISLAGAGVAVRGKGNKLLSSIKDLNGDGLLDLEVKVDTENLDPGQFQNGYAILTGQLYGGTCGLEIEGMDFIRVVPE
jgi:hypothetical protein